MKRQNTLVTIQSDDAERPLSLRLSIAQTGGYVGPNGIRRGVYTRIWAIAEGGAGGYVRTIVDGSLPTGMGPMDPATGESYGTPSQAGRWEFTVRVQDAAATVAEARFAVTVLPVLQIIEASPTPAEVNFPYSYQLRASDPNATWSIASGNLPAGLSLAANGTISGTPSGPAGVSYAQVMASAGGEGVKADIRIDVAPKLVGDSVPLLPETFEVGKYGSVSYAHLISGGVKPYRVEVVEIPDWATIQLGGEGDYRVSGAPALPPSRPEDYMFYLRVFDALGAQVMISFGVRITPPRGGVVIRGAGSSVESAPDITFDGSAVSGVEQRGVDSVKVTIDAVTSVGLSGGSTGLSVAGSPVTGAGTMTLGGTLALAHGGTGATTAAQARANLGAMQDATVPVSKGGTGATTAASARSNLGALGNVTGTSPITVTGSGDSRTVSHANSGVAAGTYANANVTVDARGHVTSISAGGAWGSITGNIASQLDLQVALNGKGGLATANEWTQVQTMHAPIVSPGVALPSGLLAGVVGHASSESGLYVIPGGFGTASAALANNLYPINLANFAYQVSGFIGSVLRVSSSGLQFQTAPSGTAGATATLTTRFQISPAGAVTMDATTAGSMLTALGAMPRSGGAFTGAISAPDVTATSDSRHKSSIRPLAGALEAILALRPRRYWNKLTRREEVGLIAQEVRPVLPDIVTGEPGNLSVSYARVVAPLIGAVQELAVRIEALEARRGAAE